MATSFCLGTATGFMLGVTGFDLAHDVYLLGENMVEIVQTLEPTGRPGLQVDLESVRAYYHRISHSQASPRLAAQRPPLAAAVGPNPKARPTR